MKMFKIVMVLLVAALALSACSGKELPASNEETRTADKSVSTDDKPDVMEKAPVIRMVVRGMTSADKESIKVIEAIERGMESQGKKVKLQVMDIAAGNYAEKLSSLIGAGELPDIIYFSGHSDLQFVEERHLVDLVPYVEGSQYIIDIMGEHNSVRLKNYPYLLNTSQPTPNVPVIRKDWLEKLDTSAELVNNPTVESYYTFLKDLKEKDLDGNGNPIVGITTDGYINELDAIFNMAFGITGTWVMDEEEGRFVYSRTTENEKRKLEFYRRLYKEEILGPKDRAKTSYNKLQLFYTGEAGVVCGSGWELNMYDRKLRSLYGDEAEPAVLPPAIGESQGYGAASLLKESDGFGITRDSRNRQLAFDVLDFMASPEGRKIDWLGIKGRHYDVKKEEIFIYPEYEDWMPRFWTGIKGLDFGIPLSEPVVSNAMYTAAEMAEKWFKSDINFLMYKMEDDYIRQEEYYKAWYYIEKLYADFSSDIITGTRSIDEFDDFVKRWYQNGGEVITRYANRNIDIDKCLGIAAD